MLMGWMLIPRIQVYLVLIKRPETPCYQLTFNPKMSACLFLYRLSSSIVHVPFIVRALPNSLLINKSQSVNLNSNSKSKQRTEEWKNGRRMTEWMEKRVGNFVSVKRNSIKLIWALKANHARRGCTMQTRQGKREIQGVGNQMGLHVEVLLQLQLQQGPQGVSECLLAPSKAPDTDTQLFT